MDLTEWEIDLTVVTDRWIEVQMFHKWTQSKNVCKEEESNLQEPIWYTDS
jgi:hypothetical protein